MVAIMEADDATPMFEPGTWLVQRRRVIDTSEGAWLEVLVDFDASGAWLEEGALSCVEWLMRRCRMARSTAFEKLQVAHELRRRPRVAAALAAGELSYSAVRLITSISGACEEVDDALVSLGANHSVRQLERAVRHYQHLADQERDSDPTLDRYERRGLRLLRQCNGLATAEVVLSDTEIEELDAALDAFVERGSTEGQASTITESAADSDGGEQAQCRPQRREPMRCWVGRRADAFMDLVRCALAHAKHGQAVGADRYMVHVVADLAVLRGTGAGRCELIGGRPIAPAVLARLACDSSTVGHLVGPEGEPLALGRRCRGWSSSQRRAITVRDGGRCRFLDCGHTKADIHHLVPWEEGGPTDIANGALLCPRHHTLVHHGYTVEGDANGPLTYHAPDGTCLGTSDPAGRLDVPLPGSGC